MSTNASPVTAPPSASPSSNMFDQFASGTSSAIASAAAGTAAAVGSTGIKVLPPGTAGSAYQFENYLAGQKVTIGAVIAGTLGLRPATYDASQIIQAMDNLPQAQLVALEEQLQQGGFYTDAEGNPLQSGMTFGTQGNALSFQAMANAIIAASNAGTTIDSVIAQGIGSGAGQRSQQSLPSGTLGGGNVYTINLANPEDVAYTANQVFQAALGRNATPGEVSKITGALRAQERQQGYASEAAHETAARAQYQAQVNLNNANYQYEMTPKVALGNLPTGPYDNPIQWATAILQYLGAAKGSAQRLDTPSNIAFLAGWAAKEGGNWGNTAQFNPLNSTLELPGSQVMSGGNSAGVQSYQSWAQGIQATVDTLAGYPAIWAALESGDAMGRMNSNQVANELRRWSNGGYSSVSSEAQSQLSAATDAATQAAQQQEFQGYVAPTPQGAQASQMQVSLGALGVGMPAGSVIGGGATGAPAPNPSGIAPQDASGGQRVTNPANQYIPAVTDITVNPASTEAAAYNAATTGPNRIPYAGNTYLNAYNAILAMIKAGGPTSG